MIKIISFKNINTFILLLFLCSISLLSANEFIVKSFERIDNDLSARRHAKYDINENLCALIKVYTDITASIQFDSNLGIPHEIENKNPGEYWVYVSPGERSLKLMAIGYIPKIISLEGHGIIKSRFVYKIKVSSKNKQEITNYPVLFVCEQDNCEKWVDGKNLGNLDSYHLSEGKHELIIKKKGFKDFKKEINITSNNLIIRDIVLEKLKMIPVRISSDPGKADLYFDDEYVGKTGEYIELSEGMHIIEAKKNGYQSQRKAIIVNDNMKYFHIKLEKEGGYLLAKATPKGAELRLNNKYKTYDTNKKISLPNGKYSYEIFKDGYESARGSFSIKHNKGTTIKENLISEDGYLFTRVTPEGAKLRLNNDLKTYETNKKLILSPGEYSYEIFKDKYKSKRGSFSIKLNKETILNENLTYLFFNVVDIYEMVFVKGGSFKMGSNSGDNDEKPVHKVTLSDYYMGKYEVTQFIYEKIMGKNPSHFKGKNRPVEMVSWYDAVKFCNQLSEQLGFENVYNINGKQVSADLSKDGFRLPTEAEWEYAARGGNQSKRYKYSGSNNCAHVAWFYDNSYSLGPNHKNYGTQAVGSKHANELGFHDMSGNVWEWCWDRYGSYKNISPAITGTSSRSFVLRGGCWNNNTGICRIAYRGGSYPSSSNRFIGFRLTRSAR